MKIYPILNNLGKGKYVFIFILNERAVTYWAVKSIYGHHQVQKSDIIN